MPDVMRGLILASAMVALLTGGTRAAEAQTLEARRWSFLPESAAAAVRAAYPGAVLWDVSPSGQEEWGLYSVELAESGGTVDVKITADGIIVETQREITQRELPRPTATGLAKGRGSARLLRLFKREVLRERDQTGRLVPRSVPRISYEAVVLEEDRQRTLAVAPDGTLIEHDEGIALQAAGHEVEQVASLPPAAAAAFRAAYPGATPDKILFDRLGVGGAPAYKVGLERGGQELDVTITPEGLIVEAEADIATAALPPPVAAGLTRALGGGVTIWKVKRKELRARLEGGKAIRLDPPRVFYEVRYLRGAQGPQAGRGGPGEGAGGPGGPRGGPGGPGGPGGQRLRLLLEPDGTPAGEALDPGKRRAGLPAAVLAAIKASYPDAEVGGSHKAPAQGGTEVYYFGFGEVGRQVHLKVTADGTLVEVQADVQLQEIPDRAAHVLTRAATGSTAELLRKKEYRARLENGAIVKDAQPLTVYEIRLVKAGRRSLIEVAPDGTIMK